MKSISKAIRPRAVFLVLCTVALSLLVFPQQAKKPQRIINTDPQLRLQWYD